MIGCMQFSYDFSFISAHYGTRAGGDSSVAYSGRIVGRFTDWSKGVAL